MRCKTLLTSTRAFASLKRSKKNQGFTLIEVIIAMVTLSISLSVIFQLILPAEERSADQIHLTKAAELGQTLLDEIMGRSFDENSDRIGGLLRCDDTGAPACSESADFGPGEDGGENLRSLYDDVDDYHGYNSSDNGRFSGTDTALHSGYNDFYYEISVTYAGNDFSLQDNRSAKRILVLVTTPLGTDIEFAAYKANF